MSLRTNARTILDRMNRREALIAPEYQQGFVADMQELASADEALEMAADARRIEHLAGHYGFRPSSAREKPYAYADGVAVIPVHGTLLNRFPYSWSFVTGYTFVRTMLRAALEDEDVKVIVFDINSNGGEAAGCFELAEEIRAARSRKSLLAVVDSNMNSAAYAIGSACNKVYVTPSGSAGSIGVIAMHISWEKALSDMGLKVTIIAEGPHKADGNPYQDLTPEVAAEIRASVKKRYDEFVKLVAANRNLDEESIRATESRSFRADEALKLKLIDAVATPSEAVAAFLGELGGAAEEGDDQMADQNNATPNAEQAAAEARTAERARVSGIMNHAEAAGRGSLANHLAMNTDLSVEAAAAILAAAPKEAAPAASKEGEGEGAQGGEGQGGEGAQGASPFKDAMDRGGTPGVGADTNGGESEQRSRGAAANDLLFGKPKSEQAARH